MITKPKIPRAEALKVAQEVYDRLAPFCEKCKIVGSLRRQKAFVGDAEILFIPKMAPNPESLFGALLGVGLPEMMDMADIVINRLEKDGYLRKRPGEKGVTSWGPLNKFAVHVASGIAVDFFSTTQEKWWVSLVVRTGGKRNNLKLTMAANKRGLSLNAYGSGFTNLRTREKIPCHSEQDVFRIAGVPYEAPQFRL